MEAIEPLSPRAYQLADEHQLGAVRVEYSSTLIWRFFCITFVINQLQ